jgi:hypothetical protein
MTRPGDGLALPEGTGWDEAVFLAGVAAVPVIGGSLVVLLQKAFEDERRRIADVANAAREVVDHDATFVRRVEQDERLRDMLREALEAGARTSNEAKRVAMGRVLGQAVKDDAQIDDSAAMLQALAALESPHFALLARLETERDSASEVIRGLRVPEPYRSELIAQGLVTISVQVLRPTGLAITGLNDFGRRLLTWVRDAG